ncbi:Mini-ribonuclease 3 [Sporomusa acidovorans]|uniref:Mini-ribonuclease 3 n=1 Tax=Sporomusa acidovorans (strain ATCC 49682 / DSM 3132 / Mol) TaxID=1123286 RepID=A0ABZ3IWZ2_SPOA4|nr:ribonuclease III domain-containing protein [Sporomusa acidovorans]OZC13884.1 mini-ribonuclease 3 [Sporomusa acidovorans DSM 3132]SDF48820.1 ribonuclease-3 family protein [Sporomusa acidovorans]
MKFNHFQSLVDNFFTVNEAGELSPAKYQNIPVDRLPALVLAYLGDAYFTLYVRTRLLGYEQNKVRVLHTFDAKIVSAVMQAKAVKMLKNELSPEEADIVRRGRNAKSTVPKSATIAEYRLATGFEALIGYLYLQKQEARLSEIVDKAFAIISREMTNISPK